MSSPSSNKENDSDGYYSPSEFSRYSKTSVLDCKYSAKTYRHFGISPEINEEADQIRGPPVTFVFASFPNSVEERLSPFSVLQDQICTVLRLTYFGGLIVKCIENSATYPVIYFSGIDGSKLNGTHYKVDGCFRLEGTYQEVRSIKPMSSVESIKSDLPDTWKNYIVLGFKKLPTCFSQTILETWKDWTNVRYIYLNMPEEMGMSEIKLYEKHIQSDIMLFTHVVLIECCTVNSTKKQTALLDFVQRLRAKRISGYISIYKVHKSF